jgi:hypothetical protein
VKLRKLTLAQENDSATVLCLATLMEYASKPGPDSKLARTAVWAWYDWYVKTEPEAEPPPFPRPKKGRGEEKK